MERIRTSLRRVLKALDIVVLLKLSVAEPAWRFQGVATSLDLSTSAIHRSLGRAGHAGLFDARRRVVNRRGLLELLAHGARYVFPAELHGEARGLPTAWAAPPLVDLLSPSGAGPPVWPHAQGDVRGIALEPLHRTVPEAARRDPHLWELLALFDGVRIGGARERGVAITELERRLISDSPET